MCLVKAPPMPAAQRIVPTDTGQMQQEASIRDRMRRARAGAAANVLTGPRGLGVTSKLGSVAA